MQIRRFEAKNMTHALRRVKEELGSEAVILSARTLKKGAGIFGAQKSIGVEVTAAIDNDAFFTTSPDKTYRKKLKENRKAAVSEDPNHGRNNGMIQSFKGDDEAFGDRSYPRSKKTGTALEDNDVLSEIYHQLLTQDISREIAAELIEEIKRIPGADQFEAKIEVQDYLASIIEDMGISAQPLHLEKNKPKRIAFLGPTGVGKTTTIAKLAARHALQPDRQVALVSIDHDRIAAIEPLKIYARIIGVPLAVAANAAELKKVLKRWRKKDLILIDTPGFSQNNEAHIFEIKRYFEKLKSVEIHLLLSATTKEKDLVNITEKLQSIPVHRVIISKIDESNTYGNLFNLLARTKIPLSYLTNGPRVPEDLIEGSSEQIVDLIFTPEPEPNLHAIPAADRAAYKSFRDLNDRPHFVANKNSDLYHCPDCKWTKKIKPANMIRFESAVAAENENFIPCRNCTPNRAESIDVMTPARDKISISGYRY